MEEGTDRYANAKATLRDNVKWLAGSFAGLAALILAGTPFTGYGSLDKASPRFIGATVGLFVAVLCLFIAWIVLLRMLRPDVIYPRYLRAQFKVEDEIKGRAARREINALRVEFTRQHKDLLPQGKTQLTQFDQLEALRENAWNDWARNQSDQGKHTVWQNYRNSTFVVLYWASYTVLHYRITRGFRWIIGLGAIIVLAISVFAWAANPPKAEAAGKPGAIIIDESGAAPASPAVAHLEPVSFEHAQSKLTPKGWEAINAARNFLRREAGAGVLLLAHTDTSGGPAVNERLARERVAAVYRALTNEGGIAATRVFIAELPERDLPIVTPQDTRNEKNRDVEFMIVALPPR